MNIGVQPGTGLHIKKTLQDLSWKIFHDIHISDSRRRQLHRYGVCLCYVFGWWWADAVAVLAMLPVILWQGWETLEEPVKNNPPDFIYLFH